MAPRQTARRLLVAAPALALALAVTACSPPNEEPADPNAPYTLPTYSEEAEANTSEEEHSSAGETTTVVETTTVFQGAPGEAGAAPLAGEGQPAVGQADPAAPTAP